MECDKPKACGGAGAGATDKTNDKTKDAGASEDESEDEGEDEMRVALHDEDAVNIVATYCGSKAASSRNRSVRKRKGILPEEAADPPPACQLSEAEGPFWFEAPRTIVVADPKTGRRHLRHKGITSQERQRLRELLKMGFITEDFLRTVVRPTTDETSDAARLRAHDFALTNWLKGRPLLKQIRRADGVTELSDISVDYDQQLDRDHRKLFDAFRRGTHIFYELDGATHHTTVGQLSLLEFEMRNDVTGCVEEHEDEIREQMKEAAKSKPAPALDGKRRRRRELTKTPSKYSRGAIVAEYNLATSSREEEEAEAAGKRALFAKTEATTEVKAGTGTEIGAEVESTATFKNKTKTKAADDEEETDEVSKPASKRMRVETDYDGELARDELAHDGFSRKFVVPSTTAVLGPALVLAMDGLPAGAL